MKRVIFVIGCASLVVPLWGAGNQPYLPDIHSTPVNTPLTVAREIPASELGGSDSDTDSDCSESNTWLNTKKGGTRIIITPQPSPDSLSRNVATFEEMEHLDLGAFKFPDIVQVKYEQRAAKPEKPGHRRGVAINRSVKRDDRHNKEKDAKQRAAKASLTPLVRSVTPAAPAAKVAAEAAAGAVMAACARSAVTAATPVATKGAQGTRSRTPSGVVLSKERANEVARRAQQIRWQWLERHQQKRQDNAKKSVF